MRGDGRCSRRGRWGLALGLLVVPLAVACSAGTEGSNGAATTASGATGTSATTAAAEPERISGDFAISNTTRGPGAAVVETVVVSIESAPSAGGPWTDTGASCTTSPATPIRIATSRKISYACRFETTPPDGQRRRVVVQATIAGSDEVFRIVSEIPR